MPMDSAPLIKEPEPAHVEQEFGQEDDWYETLTGEKRSRATLMNTGHAGLTDAEAAARIRDFGRNCLPEKERNIWLDLAKQFWGPMPGMIWGAIIIEAVIASTKSSREWADFSVLLVLQILNAVLGWYEDMKAGDAVDALKNALKPQCDVKRNGKWLVADATMLVPGDRVKLCAGGGIPADCEICESQIISVDQAALMGESMPVSMRKHDKPKMGSTVTRGETEALVFATGSQTFFGKTAALIGSVDEEGHFQKILMRITIFLLVMSCILVSIAFFVLMHRGGGFLEALVFCVVLLVASIPIALPVVSTSTMALGSKSLAAEKAIVTRLASIEEVAGMNMLCSDKTGTLTKGKMVLQDDIDTFAEGITRDDVLTYSVLAMKWREPPADAIDTLVSKATKCYRAGDKEKGEKDWEEDVGLQTKEHFKEIEYYPFDPEKKMTWHTLQNTQSGKFFTVAKGAPHVILEGLDKVRFGDDSYPGVWNKEELHEPYNQKVNDYSERGIRALTVSRSEECDSMEALAACTKWEMLGIITFKDPPREDTADTIRQANSLGVEVKMITGDHAVIAREMARTIGMGSTILDTKDLGGMVLKTDPVTRAVIIPTDLGEVYGARIEDCNGFAQVFPEHKFLIVEALRQRGWAVGMTGDGVNDAPALKKADIGIAVQGATEAARQASDIVLTQEGLSTIVRAIEISRMIFQRLKNYVTYRIACTIQLLLFFFIGVCFIHIQSYPLVAANSYQFYHNDILGNGTTMATEVVTKECLAEFATLSPLATSFTIAKTAALTANCLLKYPKGATPLAFNKPTEEESEKYTGQQSVSTPNASPCTNKALTVEQCVRSTCTDAITNATTTQASAIGGTLASKLAAASAFATAKVRCSPLALTEALNAGARSTGATSFQLPVIAIVLITALNDGTIISIAYDFVHPSPKPCAWHLPEVFVVSTLLGIIAVISTLLLLHLGLKGTLNQLDEEIHYGTLQCMIYLKISLSDFLTVFAARTRGPFFERHAATILLCAACFAMGFSTFLCSIWPAFLGELKALSFVHIVFVWGYCVGWFLIQDAGKVIAYKVLGNSLSKNEKVPQIAMGAGGSSGGSSGDAPEFDLRPGSINGMMSPVSGGR